MITASLCSFILLIGCISSYLIKVVVINVLGSTVGMALGEMLLGYDANRYLQLPHLGKGGDRMKIAPVGCLIDGRRISIHKGITNIIFQLDIQCIASHVRSPWCRIECIEVAVADAGNIHVVHLWVKSCPSLHMGTRQAVRFLPPFGEKFTGRVCSVFYFSRITLVTDWESAPRYRFHPNNPDSYILQRACNIFDISRLNKRL